MPAPVRTDPVSRQSETARVRQTSLGWMMKRVASRLDGAMNARLAPHGLDLTAFAVMMGVLEHAPLSQAALGQFLGMEPYKVSRALDRLEALGLVKRRPDPASRRAHDIRPTRAGMDLAPQLHGIVAAMNADLAAPLSAEERTAFADMLHRMMTAQADWPGAGD